MAVEFDGGVVMGADSRTSTGRAFFRLVFTRTGNYVANRVSDKITSLHDKIYVCRSGSAADTQAISEYVIYALDSHAIELGEAPLVKTAASLVQQMCYYNKDNLTAGMIVAGWDKALGGQVYCIPLGGLRVRQPFAIGGSGSTYIYAYCDSHFKEGMNKDEAVTFVRNCMFSVKIHHLFFFSPRKCNGP